MFHSAIFLLREARTERQRDKETERQRDRETERQREVSAKIFFVRQVAMSHCLIVSTLPPPTKKSAPRGTLFKQKFGLSAELHKQYIDVGW